MVLVKKHPVLLLAHSERAALPPADPDPERFPPQPVPVPTPEPLGPATEEYLRSTGRNKL